MQWLSTVDGSFEQYVERYRPYVIEMTQSFSGKVGHLLSSVDSFRGAELATLLQIDALYPKRFDACSSGEQQIVRVAYALLNRPDSIVLIEPFRHLDQFRREHLEMLLRRISEIGVQIGYTERAKNLQEKRRSRSTNRKRHLPSMRPMYLTGILCKRLMRLIT